MTADRTADALPTPWQRLLALSGVAFAVLFVVGWFASGGDAPDYRAADQDWTDWAEDNQWRSRIGAFVMLLAGFVFSPGESVVHSGPGLAAVEPCPERGRLVASARVYARGGSTDPIGGAEPCK
jgi:hypothetical protein